MLNKELILDSLIQHQEEIIKDFDLLLKRYLVAADIDEEDTKDVEDYARQGISTDMVHSAELQLIQAKNDLLVLKNLDISIKEVISPGAVVITDKYNFFISVANHSFKVDGKEFIGLAFDSPIYQYMRLLPEGEKFSFNKQEYLIKEIY
ncbi:MAG: hypothetical protein H6579_08475 [Chitinophagales bacterium]|nr:hypothetical protein [Chitinophagales bacterium]